MNILKKCPFCGGEPIIIRHEFTGAKDTFGVKCNQCKSQGNQFYTELDDTVSMWNERYNDFKFVETEEDAKNYQIPDNLPTRQDVEKFLKKFDQKKEQHILTGADRWR